VNERRGERETRIRGAAAAAVRRVPGVVFPRPAPGPAELLSGPAGRYARDPAGVQVGPAAEPGGWDIRVELAVGRGHRALDVTRAVRAAVTEAVAGVLAEEKAAPQARVTVTVTDID
jgi:hypothetical protein